MKKNTYERASLEVVAFDAKDIITTSYTWDGDNDDVIILPDDNFNRSIFG